MQKDPKYENEMATWDMFQLIKSLLLFTLFSAFCIYVLWKVKFSMKRETYLTIAGISICQIMRIICDSLDVFSEERN